MVVEVDFAREPGRNEGEEEMKGEGFEELGHEAKSFEGGSGTLRDNVCDELGGEAVHAVRVVRRAGAEIDS